MEKVAVQTEIGTMNLAMTPELKAALLSLEGHPGWKTYSTMLRSQSDQLLRGLFSVDQKEYAKRIGKAEGLSLSVNFLGLVIRQFEQKQDKLVATESKK